jgi:hypothetical protein
VFNLAVGGYGTDHELLRLEREGLRYRPDVVILNFCLTNDVLNNSSADSEQVPKPYFSWEGKGLRLHDRHLRRSALQRLAQWVADESHLYHRLRSLVPHGEEGTEGGARGTIRMRRRAATALTFRLIRRIDEVTRRAGARSLVLLHPDEPAYRQRSPLRERFCWTKLLDEISVVDLGERYRDQGFAYEQVALDYQGHLTALGHHLAAEVIEGLLAEAPPRAHRVACRGDEVLKDKGRGLSR